ncbi:apoptotic chromatin condensation inducer 1b [Morone saxatilis]|uniref:apoptotic chromatin condensation inducer 1b n=1 Tax=Morone saxatilis TaxID=34816 RepID=UPI0015E237FB|nr:apoptotic chromatin condensation inducer 1b [Morone saxatilis]
MADEDITLDGKPLQSLRVADLKAALEQRNLPKSGQKNTLIKRLKGALMLENLQKSSSSHSGLQPNSQIGEEMSQNSFIKQYLAKQQELLRQRLEREAQQDEEADESPAVPEEDDDHSEDNDSSSYVSDKHRSIPTQPSMTRAEEKGGHSVVGHGLMACGPDMGPGPTLHPQESLEAPAARVQRATFHQGHKEPPAPSPPRAVASLSVRVLGQPDRQGLPPAVSRAQEKEGTAPSEPGSAHPVLHLSRSAGVSAGRHDHEDNDEDDSSDDESEDDEDWGPGPGGARRGNRAPPQPQQMPPSVPSTVARSKRKLQPPQHIPPPQAQHTPMQLRHPTPPPSPPPDLFPLPDTPKQSPPDPDDQEGEGPGAARGPRAAAFPPSTMQRQDSDSSSRSSSPEPLMKRRPGPLSLLVHKMESEGAFRAVEAASAADVSGEKARSAAAASASSSESPLQKLEKKRQQENREVEEEQRLKEEKEREQHQEQEKERRKIQEQEREKKRLEEEKEKERKRLEEEEKLRQKEEREKERKRQEEEKEKERKRQDEEKRKEEKLQKEKYKREEIASKGRASVTEPQDSGSSSDSDSKSDSSSHSPQSSSSSGDKTRPARQLKVSYQTRCGCQSLYSSDRDLPGKTTSDCGLSFIPGGSLSRPAIMLSEGNKNGEVSEPSTAAVTEVEPDTESSMAQQPPSGAEPENSEGRLEESTTPKAFAARKISLTSSKMSPATTDGGVGEAETGTAAGRKRRWGSSTSVTAKKPSISITTDSLKSLIPDIKVNQEAVVELHPEELQLSGDEESLDASRGDQDKGLKIRRTVTQVVPGDSQENGQTNEEEEVEKTEKEKQRRTSRDKRKNSVSEDASETQTSVKLEGEAKKVTPSDSLVRRSISQQKSGVSVTIDDPVRTNRQPSPPHGKVSNIIHVTNLVRPFTLGQLKELLNRTGSVVEDGFWIDKIKSHCFVTYATAEEAVATRAALHGVKWPPSNPKVLSVDFCEQTVLDFHKGILKPQKEEEHVAQPVAPQTRLPPLMPERDRERERDREGGRDRDRERDRGVAGVRDLWAEREREMQRRERARGEREWDRDKVREFARPGEEEEQRSRSRDRERRRRERAKSKERKTDKKEKGDEPPAKLLDDLFLKTKAAPCIYWLPLTEEQAAQRVLDRTERQKERERRRKEQQEEEEKKREEEKKERLKGREKDVSVAASAGASARGTDGDRERDRGRDREADKKRDSGHRPRRPSAGVVGGRRSRSRSNPRDRRR